jgi:hypothetical protein
LESLESDRRLSRSARFVGVHLKPASSDRPA